MYLLQLVQALKYENFNDIQSGLDPGSKRDSQGLCESTTLGDLDRWVTKHNMKGKCSKLTCKLYARACGNLPGFRFSALLIKTTGRIILMMF